MRRMADGDQRAAALLYDRYGRRLYGLGVRLLGDSGLAEELVQETFVRLWRTASSYRADLGSVATFVFTIARRLAIDLWRRPSSRPFEPEPAELHDADGRDPIDAVIAGVTVRDALDGLGADHRQVIELAYNGGLTQQEIAVQLGVPLGTVKTRTFHALRALKVNLADRGLDA